MGREIGEKKFVKFALSSPLVSVRNISSEIGIFPSFQYIAVRKGQRVVFLGMHMEKEIL